MPWSHDNALESGQCPGLPPYLLSTTLSLGYCTSQHFMSSHVQPRSTLLDAVLSPEIPWAGINPGHYVIIMADNSTLGRNQWRPTVLYWYLLHSV